MIGASRNLLAACDRLVFCMRQSPAINGSPLVILGLMARSSCPSAVKRHPRRRILRQFPSRANESGSHELVRELYNKSPSARIASGQV